MARLRPGRSITLSAEGGALSAARPADADARATLANQLGLVEPRLVHRGSRLLTGAGALTTTITTIITALKSHGPSSDPAWAALAA